MSFVRLGFKINNKPGENGLYGRQIQGLLVYFIVVYHNKLYILKTDHNNILDISTDNLDKDLDIKNWKKYRKSFTNWVAREDKISYIHDQLYCRYVDISDIFKADDALLSYSCQIKNEDIILFDLDKIIFYFYPYHRYIGSYINLNRKKTKISTGVTVRYNIKKAKVDAMTNKEFAIMLSKYKIQKNS